MSDRPQQAGRPGSTGGRTPIPAVGNLDRRAFLKRAGLLGGSIVLGGTGVLAACSSGDGAPTTSGALLGTSVTPAALRAIWWDWPPWNEVGGEILSEWQEQSGTQVELQLTPFEDLSRSVRLTGESDDPPDLMIVDGPQIPTYAEEGLLLPLDDYFTDQDRQDFFTTPLTHGTWDGSFYGPALDESSQALLFNRSVIERNGIQPPTSLDDAWTWEEALDVFRQVQEGERSRRGTDRFWALNLGAFGGPIGGGLFTGGTIVRSAGAPGSPTFAHISDDGLHVDGYINTGESLEGLRFIQDLYQTHGLIPTTPSVEYFPNDQVAFWLTSMSQRTYIDDIAPNLDWGVTPFPYIRTPIVHTGSLHLAVSAFSPNAQTAAETVAFFANAENALQTALAAGDLPIRTSAVGSIPEYNEDPLDVFVASAEQWGDARPVSPAAAEYDSVYGRMVSDIAGGGDIESLVEGAVNEIEQRLDRYR